jgi:diguanylate cyclase (GGDEF)-like protein
LFSVWLWFVQGMPAMSQTNLRILVAENAPGEASTSLRLLYPESGEMLDLTVVGAVATLFPTIHVVAPEAILLELSLAQPDPLEVVRRVHRSAPDVPLIVLAAESEKELALQCVREGAQDFLLKGFMDPRTMAAALRRALENNTLEGLADLLRDPVTGLHTRDGFDTLGARSLEFARQKSSTCVLVCARIENLAAMRSEFGETAVESMLRDVAELLTGCFRRTDLVARLGDAQFAVLAVDAIEPSGPVLRQRLERRITVLNQDIGPWGPLELRMSVGFWSAGENSSFAEFLDRVEGGLRQAQPASGVEMALRDTVQGG